MGRKKLPISKIPVAKNRAVTFNKRKMGLMKKAMELSVLCGVDIGLVIFNNGKLHEYSNTDASDVFNTYAEWEGEHDVLDNNDLVTLKPAQSSTSGFGKHKVKKAKLLPYVDRNSVPDRRVSEYMSGRNGKLILKPSRTRQSNSAGVPANIYADADDIYKMQPTSLSKKRKFHLTDLQVPTTAQEVQHEVQHLETDGKTHNHHNNNSLNTAGFNAANGYRQVGGYPPNKDLANATNGMGKRYVNMTLPQAGPFANPFGSLGGYQRTAALMGLPGLPSPVTFTGQHPHMLMNTSPSTKGVGVMSIPMQPRLIPYPVGMGASPLTSPASMEFANKSSLFNTISANHLIPKTPERGSGSPVQTLGNTSTKKWTTFLPVSAPADRVEGISPTQQLSSASKPEQKQESEPSTAAPAVNSATGAVEASRKRRGSFVSAMFEEPEPAAVMPKTTAALTTTDTTAAATTIPE